MAGYVGLPGIAYYAGSKLAVECIFEALAKEVRHLGIRVTAIAPDSFRADWAGFGARGAWPTTTYFSILSDKHARKRVESNLETPPGLPERC
jgi:short-subunit dehydrogenase